MKLKSIFAGALGLGMVAGSAYAAGGISFDTLRVQTTAQIEHNIPLMIDGINMLRHYYNGHGVFMTADDINVADTDIDNGAMSTLKNDARGALTITFKSSDTDEGTSKVLSGKYIMLMPVRSGDNGAATPGDDDHFYSYDNLRCATNITLNGHHGEGDDTDDGDASNVLKRTAYFKNFECKYSATAPATYDAMNTLYNPVA